MKKHSRDPLIAQCLAIVVLLVALQTSYSSGYYVLLRLVICGICAYLAVTAYQRRMLNWVWILGGLAVLYNPLIPVRLNRAVWFDVNVATIALIGLTIWIFLRGSERPQEPAALLPARRQNEHGFWTRLVAFIGFDTTPEVTFLGFDATPDMKLRRSIDTPGIRECKCCGQMKITQLAFLVENISYFYARRERRFQNYMCFSCMTRTFAVFEARTLLGTWWGIIGMFVGPWYLLWNLIEYLKCSYRLARSK